MDPEALEQLLCSLTKLPEGWGALLPGEWAFIGQPTSLIIQTEPIPKEEARFPNSAEISLTRTILTNLAEVTAKAEESFIRHHANQQEFVQAAAHPHIWVNEDALEYDGPLRWTFVVESSKNPFYGTHIDFEGTEVLRTWSGD